MQPPATRRIDSLLALPRGAKKTLAVMTDAALCVLTVWLAICFRFEAWVSLAGYQWFAVVLSIVLVIPLLTAFGFYHTVIRFAGKQTITAALRAIGIYALIYSAVFTAYGFQLVPRTIGILQPLLLLIGLALVRLLASQLLNEQLHIAQTVEKLPSVLIYGAGNSGQQLAASLKASGQTRIVGFLDDNVSLQKARIAGIPIHSPSELPTLVKQYEIRDVLLAMPGISRSQRNQVIQRMSGSELAIRTLPRLSDLAQGHVDESDLRQLDIEDLLGRDPVPAIPELLAKNLHNKTVLITGSGGSIGSEIARQVLMQKPQKLVIFDISEYAIYALLEELNAWMHTHDQNISIEAVLGSVTNHAQINSVFQRHAPQTVFHAAAYKHVPLVENNIHAAIINNIHGTRTVARAAVAHACEQFTLISTDKAVRPTNVMGATKRVAELCIHQIQQEAKAVEALTKFTIVRFGNVLGSSGSVVPKFRAQIASGGPVTITHPAITRYFMTIAEAAQLVIQASAMPKHTDSCTYLLDMGEPVKILDLAHTMIKLAGFSVAHANASSGIAISFTGLRPGEKLYEELLVDGTATNTDHPKIMLDIGLVAEHNDFDSKLNSLINSAPDTHISTLIQLLVQLVPDFHHRKDN
jgi:FlaA1/EpsC-like NDP-sugar epimerase